MKISTATILSCAAIAMLLSTPNPSRAASIISYLDGTASDAPTFEATGITGANLTYNSNDTFRTSFGGAGDTPAGPTAGSAVGSNWRLFRKNDLDTSTVSTDDYASFSFTVGAAAAGTQLGDLTFDLAGGAANSASGGIDVAYEVYTNINGGGFVSQGTSGGFQQLIADADINQFSDVLTSVVDLSGAGALNAGDSVEVRIALATEDNVGAANIGLFIQGIQLEMGVANAAAVPEPSTITILMLASLSLVGVRRSRRVRR
jgi:hypothetical protein